MGQASGESLSYWVSSGFPWLLHPWSFGWKPDWVKWMNKYVSTLMETHYWKTRTLAHLLCSMGRGVSLCKGALSTYKHPLKLQLLVCAYTDQWFMSIYACSRGKFCHSEPDWRRFWRFPMGLGCWFLTWLYPWQICTCTQGVVHSLHAHSGLHRLPTHEQQHCREMLIVFMLKEEDAVHEPWV